MMNYLWGLFSCLFLGSIPMYADHAEREDSLISRIKAAQDIEKKIEAMQQLGYSYLTSAPAKADSLSDEILSLSKAEKYLKGEALAYNMKAEYESQQGHYDSAVSLFLKSIKILNELADNNELAYAYRNIAASYQYLGDYNKSKDFLKKSIEEFIATDDSLGLAYSYNVMGNLLRALNKEEESVSYHQKSLECAMAVGDNQLIAISSLNIAGSMDYVDHYKLVLSEFNRAKTAFEKINDKKGIAIALNNMASAHLENNNGHEAVLKLNESLILAKEIQFKQLELNNYWLLQEAYRLRNDFRKAHETMLIYSELNSQLIDDEKAKKIAELEELYDKEQKTSELHKQQLKITELRGANNLRLVFIFGLSALVVLGLMLFIVYSNKKKVRELELRDKIKQQLREIQFLKMNPVVEEGINAELIDALSARELDVLKELSFGKTNKEISNDLYISVNTVKTHLLNIYEKLGVKNRTEATRKAGEMNF